MRKYLARCGALRRSNEKEYQNRTGPKEKTDEGVLNKRGRQKEKPREGDTTASRVYRAGNGTSTSNREEQQSEQIGKQNILE